MMIGGLQLAVGSPALAGGVLVVGIALLGGAAAAARKAGSHGDGMGRPSPAQDYPMYSDLQSLVAAAGQTTRSSLGSWLASFERDAAVPK